METLSDSTDREAVLAFLFGRINYERTSNIPYGVNTLRLDRMRDLLEHIGRPQDKLKIIHVAGTKGKGSTAAMLGAILASAGFRTGLYTSPHLEKLEERMKICGDQSEVDLVKLFAKIRPAIEEMDRLAELSPPSQSSPQQRSGPTFFEITTAMALLYFAQQSTDAVILEVGLGGRLDSTNVCQPLLSIITNISFDHMKQLGNSLSAIAREKAGIIKPGVPVISGVVNLEARREIETIATQQNSRLYQRGTDFDYSYQKENLKTASIFAGTKSLTHEASIRGWMDYYENSPASESGSNRQSLEQLALSLHGKHQAENAALVLAAISRLQEQGWQIPEKAIRRGLLNVTCPARIEIVQNQPLVVLDAAHNIASVEALIETLNADFVAQRRTLIFASSRDKDAKGMLQRLLPQFQTIILTRYLNNPRSHPPEELLALALEIEANTESQDKPLLAERFCLCHDPQSAWNKAQQAANDDLICIAGSFFLAAEIRAFLNIQAKSLPGLTLQQV